MNALLKPAFAILSETTKRVLQERHLQKTGSAPADKMRKSQEFLEGKPASKPTAGSVLAELDKRLELIELGGEVARLELLLSSLKKSKKYSPPELHSLEAKINLLKTQVKRRISS